MSLIHPDFDRSLVVREADAEIIGRGPRPPSVCWPTATSREVRSPRSVSPSATARTRESADILIVITPGVERFEYFRHLERIAYGTVPPESLLDVQELYDTYFQQSEAWNSARA